MSQKFFSLILALSFVQYSISPSLNADEDTSDPQSATGPRSKIESQVLWQSAELNFLSQNFKDAAQDYQRLVDRYPSDSRIRGAHARLGECYLELNQPARAIRSFRSQLALTRDSIEQIRIRLKIGSAYLVKKSFHEALLLSDELLKRKPTPPTPFELEVFSKMLKAQALRGLKHFSDAFQLTDEIRQTMAVTGQKFSHLENPVRGLEVSMKLSRCARLAEADQLDETQALQEIDRRGECVVSALDHSLKLSTETTGSEIKNFLREAKQAIRQYSSVCKSPPHPVGKKTKKQIATYMKEMQEAVSKSCAFWAQGFRRTLTSAGKAPWSELLLEVDESFGPAKSTSI